MITITANGTAHIAGIDFPEQMITVFGEDNSINKIVYGECIIDFVIDALNELLDTPVDYWAVPEVPKPYTIKAAYVALVSIFGCKNVSIDGLEELDTEPYVPGRIY